MIKKSMKFPKRKENEAMILGVRLVVSFGERGKETCQGWGTREPLVAVDIPFPHFGVSYKGAFNLYQVVDLYLHYLCIFLKAFYRIEHEFIKILYLACKPRGTVFFFFFKSRTDSFHTSNISPSATLGEKKI